MKKVLIIFPYGGYEAGTKNEELFWKIVEHARLVDDKPIVVLNKDTERATFSGTGSGKAEAFLSHPNTLTDQVEILRVWAVDTCQMWLAGWGYVLDTYGDEEEVSRLILLPGDIEEIKDNAAYFFRDLKSFIRATEPEIVIGDYDTGNRYSAKELIDWYGTYSLLANWFPEISKSIQNLPLRRPRSEFLNVDKHTLAELLRYRKFAYEQTLNMLIRLWDGKKWKYKPHPHFLGTFHDDKTFRQYRGALDQIERTERMLRVLWKEQYEPKEPVKPPSSRNKAATKKYEKEYEKYKKEYKKFSDEYDKLDRASTGIRENARITIRALLGT